MSMTLFLCGQTYFFFFQRMKLCIHWFGDGESVLFTIQCTVTASTACPRSLGKIYIVTYHKKRLLGQKAQCRNIQGYKE